MLVAISAVSELGYSITAFQILPKLFYPMFLFVSSLIWIYVIPEGKVKLKHNNVLPRIYKKAECEGKC